MIELDKYILGFVSGFDIVIIDRTFFVSLTTKLACRFLNALMSDLSVFEADCE